MFEINKNTFGEFLAAQRKEKGYTQKELAARLFVSDKAVSKWERGLSMPDISLLMPLADILDVTVTELLEGRKLDQTVSMNTGQVETIVKKALTFSDETPEKRKEKQKRHAAIFGIYVLLSLTELLAGIWFLKQTGINRLSTNLLVMELLSLIFGAYFWFFIRERLPAYYDENPISAYSDGIFRMNMPGICFNNSNWPYIIKAGRIWTAVTLITVPAACLLLSVLPPDIWLSFGLQTAALLLYLGGLFVPIYVMGKKYG